jgi:hypothetical protein
MFLQDLIDNPVHVPGESITEFSMRRILAETYLAAAEECNKQKTHPWGSDWNMACQACEVALQQVAHDLLSGKKTT